MSNSFRGNSRGGGGRPRGNGGRRSGARGGHRDNSIDRRSVQNEQYSHRFDNYRQPPGHHSRSNSPPPNRMPQDVRNQYDRSASRPGNDRDREDRRTHSPDTRMMRQEDRRFDGSVTRNEPLSEQSSSVREVIDNDGVVRKVTDKMEARTWKLRIADAEEEVRRAEFALHRAKIDQDALMEAYKEYTETTIPQQLLRKNSNW